MTQQGEIVWGLDDADDSDEPLRGSAVQLLHPPDGRGVGAARHGADVLAANQTRAA